MSTNELNDIVAQKEFGFSGKFGGSIDIVSAPSQAVLDGGNHILSQLGNTAVQTAQAAAVGAAAGLAALGTLDPVAIGIGAMSGLTGSVLGGKKPSPVKGWKFTI